MKKEEALGELLNEAAQLLEDIYQGGFSTVSESCELELERIRGQADAYGMEVFSQLLARLQEQYHAGRHRMQTEGDACLRAFAMVCTYVELAVARNNYDVADAYYAAWQPPGASC